MPSLFERFAARAEALAGAPRLVVACSGGSDSTALLVLLSRWGGVSLVAAHVNHGIRGAAGDRDAASVANLGASLGVRVESAVIDVPGARGKGESLEAAARRERYRALLSVATASGPGTLIATGHTLDDQAETVLLNLARHLGRSRGGISPRRADGVVRPLLPFFRAELRDFLRIEGIAWREDETNENEDLLRNRIRRTVLPALEARWPGVASRLARAGEAWTRRLEALDARIDAALAPGRTLPGGPFPRALVVSLGAEPAGRLLVRAAALRGATPGGAQVRRSVDRLLRGDDRVSEAFGGLRLESDGRVVRLVRQTR